MQMILTLLFDSLSYASWLFIVALGLTLAFGVLRILNIAHGSFYALGAYATATGVGWLGTTGLHDGWSLALMLGAAVLVTVALAPWIERWVLRPFQGQDEVLLVLVTYALFLILEDLTKLIWGVNPYFASQPYGLFGQIDVGAQTYVGYDLALMGVAIALGLLTWAVLTRTRHGKIVLAVIHNPEVAASMGVRVSRVQMLAFAASVFLAALGGALTAPLISVQPGVSVSVVIVSFAVVIIGGLGSIEGAAMGALIVGLARGIAVHFAPEVELFAIYLVMALVLTFRPHGLVHRLQARKI